jgi:hypothetical protein
MKLKAPTSQQLQQAYTILALFSATFGVVEKLYTHYAAQKAKHKRKHFGFHS